jgi:hypothetical protein
MQIKMSSDNAAFSDAPEMETARILREIAARVENGHESGKCTDENGNHVGTWSFTP